MDVSARGGNQQTQFYVSGSYSEEDGILIRDEYDRITGRLNLNHELNSVFTLGANLSLSRVLNNRLSTDNGFATPLQLIAQAPISPIYEAGTEELNTNTLYFNGLLYKSNTRFEVTTYRNVGNVFGDLKLAPNLRFRSEFGVDVLDDNADEYYNSRVAENTGALQGLGVNTWNRVVNYTTNNYLTYARRFSTEHNLEAVSGHVVPGRGSADDAGAGRGISQRRLSADRQRSQDHGGLGDPLRVPFLGLFRTCQLRLQEPLLPLAQRPRRWLVAFWTGQPVRLFPRRLGGVGLE